MGCRFGEREMLERLLFFNWKVIKERQSNTGALRTSGERKCRRKENEKLNNKRRGRMKSNKLSLDRHGGFWGGEFEGDPPVLAGYEDLNWVQTRKYRFNQKHTGGQIGLTREGRMHARYGSNQWGPSQFLREILTPGRHRATQDDCQLDR